MHPKPPGDLGEPLDAVLAGELEHHGFQHRHLARELLQLRQAGARRLRGKLVLRRGQGGEDVGELPAEPAPLARVGALTLRGFQQPVPAFRLKSLRNSGSGS